MPKYVDVSVLDSGLNEILNNADVLHVTSKYSFGDSYASVVAASIANYSLSGGDLTLGAHDTTGRKITIGAKTGNNASANTSENVDNGTATSGSVSSLVDTGKSFTVDEHKGRKVTITSGTGSGQSRSISANTATTLTPSVDFDTAPDATSVYVIADDLHLAVVDSVNSVVLFVTDETTDQAITSGNPINTPAFECRLPQPV